MNNALTQTIEQVQAEETTEKQSALVELQSVELAYVGGGMGIHCWG